MVQFTDLALNPILVRALTDEGYTIPTPIQAQGIPPALAGKDVLGCAQTGTGKTAAFALPILHRLLANKPDKALRGPTLPRALILSPTRELASQIGESFGAYGRHTGFSHAIIFGGVSQFHQVRALQRGVDILVATPGRLLDLMEQRLVNLSQVGIFVLDEADRMLDMGFIQPIRRIAGSLPKTSAITGGVGRQTLLFSATMPREIMHLAESLLREPVKVSVAPVASTAALIEQRIYMVPRTRKQAMLHHLLEEKNISRAVVFTRTKHGADKVCRKLLQAGISAEAIHGNKAQNQRMRALQAFKTGRSRVLVATDVAARGLDVDGITHVFNFDIPNEPEAYVHRIGRTGRAGATGEAISFCDGEERSFLRDIERLTGKRFAPIVDLPTLPVLAPDTGPSDSGYEGRSYGGQAGRQGRSGQQPRQGGHGGYPNQPGHAHRGGGHSPRGASEHAQHQNQNHHAPRQGQGALSTTGSHGSHLAHGAQPAGGNPAPAQRQQAGHAQGGRGGHGGQGGGGRAGGGQQAPGMRAWNRKTPGGRGGR